MIMHFSHDFWSPTRGFLTALFTSMNNYATIVFAQSRVFRVISGFLGTLMIAPSVGKISDFT